MKLALDTNILAYAEGVGDQQRQTSALSLIRRLPLDATYLPVQVLAELYNVLVKKAKRSPHDARMSVLTWRDTFGVLNTSAPVMSAAADLSVDHQFTIWGAIVLSAAADAQCRFLLSEDMQDGFTWRGVSITNPLGANLSPLLEAVLTPPS